MKTEDPFYRKALHNTADLLDFFTKQLYTSLFNVAMTGELVELNELLATGERLNLTASDLRRLDDQNVKSIVELLDILVALQDDFSLRNQLHDSEG